MTADFEFRPGTPHIDLAQCPEFDLGALHINPAHRRVTLDGRSWELEPRVMRVLVVLAAARPNVVSRDRLVETCWDGRIVGDDAVNRCILSLRNLARSLTPEPFAIETVRGVGYGLTTADDAVSGERPAPVAAPARPVGRVVALAAALLVLVAGAAAWAWWRSTPIAHEPRIALGAFSPLDPDAQSTAFAKRLTDDVAGVLNENIAGLAPPDPEVSTQRADLRVGGSAQRDGDRLRVRAYLEDGRSKVTLWSRQYERPAGEEEQLRTQVAVDLSDTLLNAMEPLQQKGLRIDPRTMALWLAATGTFRQGFTIGDGMLPARAYEQVVERAPRFANARGMMAQSLALAAHDDPSASAQEMRRRARSEAETAIRIDPTTAEGAYDTLFWLARFESPGDLAKAEDVWILGLSRAPNSVGGLMRRCEWLMDLGRARTALPLCERAAGLRPLGAPWGYRYARALASTGQVEKADQVIAREVRLHPQHWWIRKARFQMKAFSGPPAEALALLHDPTEPAAFTTDEVAALDSFLRARATGSKADVDQAVAKLRLTAGRGQLGRAYLFKALVALHRLDDAFALAAPQSGDAPAIEGSWLLAPGMEAAQRDPRFWPLAARLGLVSYWRKRGAWPDFCSEPDLPFDCATEAARVSPRDGARPVAAADRPFAAPTPRGKRSAAAA
ncbi:MAG TPA: winged helix-turn-helix domain-containing protein [Phenylobacterium sp.]